MNTEERGRMIGMTRAGLQVERSRRPTRWSRNAITPSELMDTGPLNDRDSAIVVLSYRSKWPTQRIAGVFGITDRRVRKILRDFRIEVLGESD